MASMAAATATAAATSFSNDALLSSWKSSKIKSLGFQSFQPLNFRRLKQNRREFNVVKASASGLYSAEQLELTVENVDKVLENVRPYLIADGGNVDVVSVENGVVSLKLQGMAVFLFLIAPLFVAQFWIIVSGVKENELCCLVMHLAELIVRNYM